MQVSTNVEKYNQGMVRAIATKSFQDLFPLCTHNGYKHVDRLYHYYNNEGIIQLLLEKFEILSINLTTHQVQEVNFSTSNNTTHKIAQVYTVESWISSYEHQSSHHSQDVINRYLLLSENGAWKIDKVEVFTRNNS